MRLGQTVVIANLVRCRCELLTGASKFAAALGEFRKMMISRIDPGIQLGTCFPLSLDRDALVTGARRLRHFKRSGDRVSGLVDPNNVTPAGLVGGSRRAFPASQVAVQRADHFEVGQ
nr:hypothetical protein [Nitrosomonas nitrosa]